MFRTRHIVGHSPPAVADVRAHSAWMLGIVLVAFFACSSTTAFASSDASNKSNEPSLPPQVELHVPFAPTAFPAEDGEHLLYELYVTNFGGHAITLNRVEVLAANDTKGTALASFSGRSLDDISMKPGSGMDMSDAVKPVRVASGETLVLFMAVIVPAGKPVPTKLEQRLTLNDGQVQGAVIGTHHNVLKTLAPPVEGAHWLAADGPGNGRWNHHRRGIFIINGSLADSRRYAVDWKRVEHGSSHRDDGHRDTDYYAYDQPVFAVADATVVKARDGLPDNPPGHNENFHPAVPVTLANAGGNTIALALGDGEFAHYYHLKPGSLMVKVGQHVRRGEIIARIGASGDAREPHLHFEVTTAIPLLVGEGLPYVIDNFEVTGGKVPTGIGDGLRSSGRDFQLIGGVSYLIGSRSKESPLDGMVIDFDKIRKGETDK